jgi:photosystem II stability/assembly factor-like uncharacterized protein
MKINPYTFYLLLTSGVTAYSTTALSWNRIPFPVSVQCNDTLQCIYGIDQNEAIAAGSEGAIVHCNIKNSLFSIQHYGNHTFRDIGYHESSIGYAVGDSGTIYSTRNNESLWSRQISPIHSRLNSVAVLNKNHAWIAGDSGVVLHTSDGGNNWINHINSIGLQGDSLHKDDTIDFKSIVFRDSAFGCIAGNWRKRKDFSMYMTHDNGVHWRMVDINTNTYKDSLLKICIVTDTIKLYSIDTYYTSNHKQLIIRYDSTLYLSGKPLQTSTVSTTSWSREQLSLYYPSWYNLIGNQIIYGFSQVDQKTVWIAGTNCSIYRTIDGGVNWILQNDTSYQPVDHLSSIYFQNFKHGYIIGKNGTLLSTVDGGNTWEFTMKPINASIQFDCITFTDNQQGFITAHRKTDYSKTLLYKSIDTGTTWHLHDQVKIANNMKLVNGNSLLLFNDYWTFPHERNILLSTDYGISWNYQTPESDPQIVDIFPVSIDTFWGVGYPSIFKSTDRGKTLDKITAVEIEEEFNSITFSSPATGWVVGSNGTILKSIDSGQTWHIHPSPSTVSLKKIQFLSADFGWMFQEKVQIGNQRIFMTTDSGTTWQDRSIITNTKINEVLCRSPEDCWAVGDDGLILHLYDSEAKKIKLLYPDKSVVVKAGDSLLVRWNCAGPEKISIALSYDNGKNFTIYCATTENDSEEIIQISANAGSSNACILRIRSIDGSLQVNSEPFRIENGNASIHAQGSIMDELHPVLIKAHIVYTLPNHMPVTIALYSTSGKLMYKKRFSDRGLGVKSERIPVESIPGGCYLLRVTFGNKLYSNKLLIQR